MEFSVKRQSVSVRFPIHGHIWHQQAADLRQQLDNEEMPNARDVEDWLNLENELPTSPQMSDESF